MLTLNHSTSSVSVQIGSSDSNFYNGATLGVNGTIGASRLILTSNTTANLFPLSAAFVLAADGKIGAREMVVSLASPFPDFVFKPEYKLSSLLEVENYIKLNSRLPEMPSAEEVKINGLELAKTTALLVQKIEELTLYLIEQDKRIEALQKLIVSKNEK